MKRLILNLIILSLSNKIYCQIIDSVVVKPMINVDSIKYWHTFDSNNDTNTYVAYGYYQYCNCDFHSFLKVHDYKSIRKIITSEGVLSNGIRNGTWIYWKNVIGRCCDETLMYPDTTLIYKNGQVVKRIDIKAEYVYLDSDSIYIKPFVTNPNYNFLISCDKNNCQIAFNKDFKIKKFEKVDLDNEIDKIRFGFYDRECRIKLEKATKR